MLKHMSFPRKRESSLFNLFKNFWIPAFAGMTGFSDTFDVAMLAMTPRLNIPMGLVILKIHQKIGT
jgi:hypothetical protein